MPKTKDAFDAMREQTRQKIEAAALSLFARKGLSVTVGEIARAAGVSHGLMYSHHPSKDALVTELVQQAMTTSSEAILAFAESKDTVAEKIQKISHMMCQMFSEAPMGIDYFMFMVQVGLSGFQMPETPSPNPVESLAHIIVQGQAESVVVQGDPVQLSLIYWAAIQGLCCYAITGVPILPDATALNRILLKENIT